MHNESRSDREPESKPEPPKKESFIKRNGPVIFWGTMIAMPTMNLAAAIINMKTTQKGLESEQLRLAIEQLKQQATQS